MKTKTIAALCALGAAAMLPRAACAQDPARPPAAPAAASEAEQLRLQLNAQLAINQQLRNRVELLERTLTQENRTQAIPPSLDARAARPPVELESKDANTAIEQALGAKGLELLPTGSWRITPGLSFAVSGSGATRRDSQTVSLALDAGLPWGMMASARVPYVRHEFDFGSNRGLGDVSVALSKRFVNETDSTPSLIGRLGYTHNNGRDPFGGIPIGSGFRSVDVSLSAVKRIEPLVLYGTVAYAHAKPETATIRAFDGTALFQGRVAPGNSTGLSAGISLAATPDISLDAGLAFNFFRDTRFAPTGGAAFDSTRHSEGYLTLGTGFLLRKDLFLALNAAAGVTSESAKFIFSVALPYRF